MHKSQIQQQLELVKHDFSVTIQAKNHQIIELQHSLNRAQIHIKTLEQKMMFVDQQNKVLSQKFKELQLYSKERSHAISQKNIKIMQLQELVEQKVAEKEKEMQKYIDQLVQVIRAQEQELSVYLLDHQNYIEEFERLALVHKESQVERNILVQYNTELEKQIGEVETHNSSLQEWVIKANQELTAQNEQSGDLLSQVQYMMESSGQAVQ